MSKLRYGLIGSGMMGQEHIRNINLLENAAVSVICEPAPHMQAQALQLAPGAVMVESIGEILKRDDYDCLVIVSPNYLHTEQLRAIAASRPVPVLVEKPIATDPADRAFIRELARDYPAPIWVAMEYRYMPPIAELILRADESCGGINMLSIREHRFAFLPKVGDWNRFNANSGGTFVEKCCHFFDLMRLVLKAEPVRVMASAGQAHNHLNEVYDGRTPDIWDHGYVIVEFDSGARAMLELSMFAEGSRYQEEVWAVGGKGKIECFVPGPGRFWPTHLGDAPTPQVVISPREPRGPRVLDIPVDPTLLEAGDHNGSTFYQHQRFNLAARGQGPVEVTLEDGWRAVAMGMAAQDSARLGQAVLMKDYL